jgi:hypothetical protein
MLQAIAEGLSTAAGNLRALPPQAVGGAEEVAVATQQQGAGGPAPPPALLRQRVMFSRMAQKVHAELLSVLAGAQDAAAAPGEKDMFLLSYTIRIHNPFPHANCSPDDVCVMGYTA